MEYERLMSIKTDGPQDTPGPGLHLEKVYQKEDCSKSNIIIIILTIYLLQQPAIHCFSFFAHLRLC